MKIPACLQLARNRLYFFLAQATSNLSICLKSGHKAKGWNRP